MLPLGLTCPTRLQLNASNNVLRELESSLRTQFLMQSFMPCVLCSVLVANVIYAMPAYAPVEAAIVYNGELQLEDVTTVELKPEQQAQPQHDQQQQQVDAAGRGGSMGMQKPPQGQDQAQAGHYGAPPAPQGGPAAGGYGQPPPAANPGRNAYAGSSNPYGASMQPPAPMHGGAGSGCGAGGFLSDPSNAYGSRPAAPSNPYGNPYAQGPGGPNALGAMGGPAQAPGAFPAPYGGGGGGQGGHVPQYGNSGGPVARDDAPMRITPVSALNPYASRWAIKARCSSKSDMRR